MNLDSLFNVENLAGQQIPKEIADQIKVLGRVQFPLKPFASPSAVSTAGDEVPVSEQASEDRLNSMIDHVAEMEGLADQLEDMIDQLTKNMNIPVTVDGAAPNKALADAVKTLGGDNAITKEIFDKALAIVDHAPMMILGQDPVLGSMTGNGKLEGPYINCDEITRGVAKTWNTADPKKFTAEGAIPDPGIQMREDFETTKRNMALEIILMLWWNLLWPKFVIMLVIVNPLRTQIANPLDHIITFFKNMKKECGKGRFRKKSSECLKNYGPVNRSLNKFACFLFCVVPKKAYKRYRPTLSAVDFKIVKNGKLVACDCADISILNCPPKNTSEPNFDKTGNFDQLGNLMEDMDDPCASVADMFEGVNTSQPTGLGMPPNCVGAAQIVLSAVVSDALSPKN